MLLKAHWQSLVIVFIAHFESLAWVSVCSIIISDFVTDISHPMLLMLQCIKEVSVVCTIIIFDFVTYHDAQGSVISLRLLKCMFNYHIRLCHWYIVSDVAQGTLAIRLRIRECMVNYHI